MADYQNTHNLHLAYKLPPEIYSGILEQIPPVERQQVTLSLTRAIPHSPVPLYHLFEYIRLKSAESVVQLYRRLRGHAEEARWARDFSLETWTVDADVVVNLVALLMHLSRITLFVGPNFAPEHMEEMLQKPRETLRYISFRFRPYVQRATYYQFLKGAYFDTSLEALSRWPMDTLPTLSIVQDPLDPEIARNQHFAQPLVFFRLDPIATLASSPYLSSLTSLRLRVPSRQVAPFLFRSPRSAPSLCVLDLSTCNIRLNDVEALMGRFRQLRHLILDGCGIARGETQEGDWISVGKTCALATVKAAKEREKRLKVWLEAHATRTLLEDDMDSAPEDGAAPTRRVRPGRRGLATATISLRDPPPSETTPVVRANVVVPKVRIVPSPPSLCSLCTTVHTMDMDKHDAIRTEFEKGWDEGLAQLTAIRNRLYQSWKNGVRIVRIAGDPGTEDGFEGLEDVDAESAFYGRGDGTESVWAAPVLCLAGADPNSTQHTHGCGHGAARSIWLDSI